jgi:hypothetical protein
VVTEEVEGWSCEDIAYLGADEMMQRNSCAHSLMQRRCTCCGSECKPTYSVFTCFAILCVLVCCGAPQVNLNNIVLFRSIYENKMNHAEMKC